METLQLQKAVESLAFNNDIEPSNVIATLEDVVREELSGYLNVFEDDIVVSMNDAMEMQFFLLKKLLAEGANSANKTFLEIDSQDLAALEQKKKLAKQGDKYMVPISLSILSRKDIDSFKRSFSFRLKNIKMESLFQEYKKKEGQILNGTYLRTNGRDIIVHFGNAEGKLPYHEQSQNDLYRQGQPVKTYLKSVELGGRNGLSLILSRRDPAFVAKLFESEVEEMSSGIVKVKKVVRHAGRRSKVLVYSTKKEVDPVAACVGLYGNRIKGVMKILNGERIDIIEDSEQVQELIARSLSPAKIERILIISMKDKQALAVVEDEIYPLVIGRSGINIKLACELVGWNIWVRVQSQVDPKIFKVFSNVDHLFQEEESDLSKLVNVGISEEALVKLLNAGISSISELYDKSVEEIASIDGISKEQAQQFRSMLNESIEFVEGEESNEYQSYLTKEEDTLDNLDSEQQSQPVEEEIRHVEYLVCPACHFEFEFKDQKACPSCSAEFEFDDEDEEDEAAPAAPPAENAAPPPQPQDSKDEAVSAAPATPPAENAAPPPQPQNSSENNDHVPGEENV